MTRSFEEASATRRARLRPKREVTGRSSNRPTGSRFG